MRAQAIKTCEELAELTVQLSKRLNGSPTTNEAIIDEIADATIMVRQMRNLFGHDVVDMRIDHKLTKLNIALTRAEQSESLCVCDTILEENACAP